MPPQAHRASYRADRDVRDWTTVVDRIQHQSSAGVLWPIVGPRRSGKTWALKALQACFGDEHAGYLLLSRLYGNGGTGLHPLPPDLQGKGILLLDEPGLALFEPSAHDGLAYSPDHPRPDIHALITTLAALQSQGHTLVMAMTPAEWRALVHADGHRGHVSRHDLDDILVPLTRAQALTLAASPERQALVERLPADWTRSPFLLTWLLEWSFQPGLDRNDVDDLLPRFIDHATSDTSIRYVDLVLEEGLDRELRSTLRSIGETGRSTAHDLVGMLRDTGLVQQAPDGLHDIADPILAHHLAPPFRIHHVSDLHFGPKSTTMVDDKLGGSPGAGLGRAAGQHLAQDAYREHVEALPRHERPHLVIVSGDVAEMGRDDLYAPARAWLLRLRDCMRQHPHPRARPRDPCIMLVGGNHDVDWTETRGAAGARKRHLPFVRAFDGIDGVCIARLDQPPGPSRPPTRHRFVGIDLEVVLLGSAEHGGEIDLELLAATDRLRQQALAAGNAADEALALALRKRYGQLDPGLVHHEDLRHIRGTRLYGAFGIAVLHHPVSPMPSTELAPLGGLVNAGQVKQALLEAGFHLVLHGHAHSAWHIAERWPGKHGDRELHILGAPTLSSYETVESQGYNELRVHLEEDGPRVEVILHERRGDGFHASTPVPISTSSAPGRTPMHGR